MNNGDYKSRRLGILIGNVIFVISILGSLALSIWLFSQDRIWPGVGWAIITAILIFFFCLPLYPVLMKLGRRIKKSRPQ